MTFLSLTVFCFRRRILIAGRIGHSPSGLRGSHSFPVDLTTILRICRCPDFFLHCQCRKGRCHGIDLQMGGWPDNRTSGMLNTGNQPEIVIPGRLDDTPTFRRAGDANSTKCMLTATYAKRQLSGSVSELVPGSHRTGDEAPRCRRLAVVSG